MSSTMRLYLARHGRTAWNEARRFQGQSDIPLDEVGRAQAAALAELLRGQIQVVIASDLLRASESARIIADALQIPLLPPDHELRERGYGAFEGLTREECIAQHPEAWAAREGDRNFQPPGGEAPALVIARMQRSLLRVAERLRGEYERVLVVSHGSSIRMFLEVLTGRSLPPIANLEYHEVLHDGQRFMLPPG